MDFSTLIGLVMGVAILVSAILIGDIPLENLIKPEALLIVMGGTLTAVLVSFPTKTLFKSFGALKQCFYQESYTTEDCAQYLTDIASFVRANGLLPLENLIHAIEIPFLQKGLTLILDNRPENFIRDNLSTEIEITFKEQNDFARVFEAAGGYAPTMGLIGAVIGLIHVVQVVHDPIALGQGVAGAFSATLYGVALSNLFLLPIAGKLKQRARHEWFKKTILLEGIMSIRSGEHPLVLEEKLFAYVQESSGESAVMQQMQEKLHAQRHQNQKKQYAQKPIPPVASQPIREVETSGLPNQFPIPVSEMDENTLIY